MSDISMGTILEHNKSIIRQQPLPSDVEIKRMYQSVDAYFLAKNEEFYMLYCKEQSDFTVFQFLPSGKISQATADLKECIVNRGKLFSIDKTEDGIALEIWIKVDDEPYVYYLFPYTNAVIKIGE